MLLFYFFVSVRVHTYNLNLNFNFEEKTNNHLNHYLNFNQNYYVVK